MHYRLGLDVGTNSLGWAVIETDQDHQPIQLEKIGSRIFSSGRDSKTLATLAATRRQKRLARRQRDRYLQRRRYLMRELIDLRLMPQELAARKQLLLRKPVLNPVELRHRALHAKLTLFEIGRALFHLNQRRGYKSNRKDQSKEKTSGLVASSVQRLLCDMGLLNSELLNTSGDKELSKEQLVAKRHQRIKARSTAFEQLAANTQLSYGSYLYTHRQQQGLNSRVRQVASDKGSKKAAYYEVFPVRQLLEDEFDKICRSQQVFHSSVLTDAAIAHLKSVIFTQRPLKPQRRGYCIYMASVKNERALKALPSLQRYRIYQEVNNLSWRHDNREIALNGLPEHRDLIAHNLLQRSSKKEATFKSLKNSLKKAGVAIDGTFNLDTENRKGLQGDETSAVLGKPECVGSAWYQWPLERQDDFVSVLIDGYQLAETRDPDKAVEDDVVVARLVALFDLSQEQAQACLEHIPELPDGTASICVQAARLLLSKMEHSRMRQYDAVDAVAQEVESFVNPIAAHTGAVNAEDLAPRLEYYGKVFAGSAHTMPGDHDEEKYQKDGNDRRFYGGVTNPTVHISLNQIRRVVNELIACYGRPASIAIELGRELPMGAENRRKTESKQKKNAERNERARELLEEHNITPTQRDVLKYKIWEQTDRKCPFTGTRIGISDLAGSRFEIEHLLPYSRTLDDGIFNKVLSTPQANRDKGNRTPYEAFANRPDYDWEAIKERVKHLPKPCRWRFNEDAMKKYEEESGFLARQLNDTRYIGRLAKDYLKSICPYNKIDVVTGRLTSDLRHVWGLNSVLSDHNQNAQQNSEEPQKASKNRNDHRHHAIDAVVLAAVNRSLIQKVSHYTEQTGNDSAIRLLAGFPPPIHGLRDQVRKQTNVLQVAHRRRQKWPGAQMTTGQLHNENPYGIVDPKAQKQPIDVVIRWPITNFKTLKQLKKIRDPYLRKKFIKQFNQQGVDGILQLARGQGIRSLRITDKKSGFAINNAEGIPYQFVEGDSNWGLEIYEYPPGHQQADKWYGRVIRTFEANQPKFKLGCTYKPHPAARLVMRLQINDCVRLAGDSNIYRVQSLSNSVALVPVHWANVAKRIRNKECTPTYLVVSSLQKYGAYKVHISPSGRVNAEKRAWRPRKS
ncbi:MAG: type II CRISPR RNA-guided endonuclease Cas9 [Gammaproteobacteria bacterium]